MPLFEYHCPKCDATFEVLMREGTRPECPQCGEKKVEKLLSAFAAHSKGSNSASCKEVGCPGASGHRSPCSGGKCPFSH